MTQTYLRSMNLRALTITFNEFLRFPFPSQARLCCTLTQCRQCAESLPPAPHQACHSGGGRAMLTWPCTDGWRDLDEEPLERIEFWGLSVLGEPMEFCCVRMERLGATCPWLLVKPLQWLWSVPNILAWRKCLSKNSIVIISAHEPEGKVLTHSHQSWILVGGKIGPKLW